MHVSVNKQFHSLRAHYMADMEVMRQKTKLSMKFDKWERCFTDEHPARPHGAFPVKKGKGKQSIIGLITNLKTTYDRNGNQMAFFGLQDGVGEHRSVVVFSSVFDFHAHAIQVGKVAECVVRKDGRSYLMCDEGITRHLKPAT